jgi:FkbM family methyltransferase
MKILRRLRRLLEPDPNRFLRTARGVVHVGANVGQERDLYARLGLEVLWIEPIPEAFAELSANIAALPNQRAVQALLTDRDDTEYEFNIANNRGESSSILPLKQHRDVWPKVDYTRAITLRSMTLATLAKREHIELERFDALVMDTQGSELLVLRGAEPVLGHFKFVKTEVPDFEAYGGCARLTDIAAFVEARGFIEQSRHCFARHEAGGRYYDVVYARRTAERAG